MELSARNVIYLTIILSIRIRFASVIKWIISLMMELNVFARKNIILWLTNAVHALLGVRLVLQVQAAKVVKEI